LLSKRRRIAADEFRDRNYLASYFSWAKSLPSSYFVVYLRPPPFKGVFFTAFGGSDDLKTDLKCK